MTVPPKAKSSGAKPSDLQPADPVTDAPIVGIDSPILCTKYAATIAKAGVVFVGRYYRGAGSEWPTLSAGEVQALHGAGLEVVALWEAASTTLSHFSYKAGVAEGSSASHQAFLAGQPPQTPIYFAVDYDASDADLAAGIDDYFRGVADGYQTMGSGAAEYAIGVYGSTHACARLKSFGRAAFFWLAESTGWGGGVPFPDWNIKQSVAHGTLIPNYDANQARADFGSF